MLNRCNDPLNDLKQLVLKFENNELDLFDIPQEQIDEFGLACLANSLLYKEPKIPKYHCKEITHYIKTHKFDTLDSLISFIKSNDDDIDKLFTIFAYAALNIQYDAESYFKNDLKHTTLEEVFKTKLAVCYGYTLFFCEMAKLVDLDPKRITVRSYTNYAKGYGFDPLNPPEKVRSNHASIFITVDGVPFISEPTWAAGHVTKDRKFEWCYRPQLFLIPVYNSLCDHYPCHTSQKLLPFSFSYEHYIKSCRILSFDRYLKTESNPFVNFECKNGYVEQIYSCVGPIKWITIKLFKKNYFYNSKNGFSQISNEGITSYEIIQKSIPNHPERTRFRTNISLPDEGVYKVKLFIDSPFATEYFVTNLKRSEQSVPVTYNPFHESKFIPILPKKLVTTIKNGYALIRFAVSPKWSDVLWDIIKLTDQNSFNYNEGEIIDRENGKCLKLTIPFDDERYEDQLCVTFPSTGRYSVLIYLSNDIGSYSSYIKYFFDVVGVSSQKVVSPIKFLFNGRKFAPKRIVDDNNCEVILKPNQNFFLVKKTEQTLQIKTNSVDADIRLELKQKGQIVANPVNVSSLGNFRRFKWSIPDVEGEYHLLGWINEFLCFSLVYCYRKSPLKSPTKEENEILDELKMKTDQDDSKIEARNLEQRRSYKDIFSSKCCLLI